MGTRLDILIDHVRSATTNEEVSTAVGIPDSEIIRYFNEAQDRIVAKIVQQFKYVFGREIIMDIVQDQEAYDIPNKAFIRNKLISVEYSIDGTDEEYYQLRAKTILERSTFGAGVPDRYILRNGQILLSPKPISPTAKLRVNYIKKICKLDVRRGTVDAVTLDGTTNTITSLTLTMSEADVALFNSNHNYITIVDRLGNIKMQGIFAASNGITGADPTYTFNVDSSFTYEDGETIDVDDYLVFGEYASTHHELDEQVERFLTQWVIWKLFKRDSSQADTAAIEGELKSIEDDIIDSYKGIDEGLVTQPVIYNWEGWGGGF